MKKRVLVTIFAVFITLLASGCGSNDIRVESSTDAPVVQDGANGETAQGSGTDAVEVDKNLLSVEITVPSDFIESVDETLKDAEEKGYKAKANDDGSITYTLTKAQHAEIMVGMAASLEEAINDMISGGEYPSLKDVKFNNDYTKVDITVDYDSYINSFDSFAAAFVGMYGGMYQIFDGVSEDNINVQINLIDEKSGNLMDTMNYPKDFDTENN